MDNFIYTGNTGRPLLDEISINGRPFNLGSGSSVSFRMRPKHSSTLTVDSAATILDAEGGEVQYDWELTDIDTPGEYAAYWHIEFADNTVLDTPEFEIVIGSHAPGIRTETGAFYSWGKFIIPTTWTALENSFGDRMLQDRIEVIKLKVFGEEIPISTEESFDIRVQQYIGKLAVVSVIPTGIDYWMDQHTSVSATGTNENTSYPDRIAALEKIHQRLVGEIVRDRAEIEAIIGVTTSVPSTGVPSVSGGSDEGFSTPLPQEHFIPYSFPRQNTLW